MDRYYLAVDIGASSGKMVLARMDGDKLSTEEVWRFPNGAKKKNGRRCWDVDALFSEIKAGLRHCAEIGKKPSSMGVDTWGVDFVLLDGENNRLGDAVAYRDSRTAGMDAKLREILTEEELYARTGIQKQIFNTIYQLLAVKEQEPELLEKAEHLLMIPDYLHFLLTGQISAEYTNASTTQLLDAKTCSWDFDLIDRLGAVFSASFVSRGIASAPCLPKSGRRSALTATSSCRRRTTPAPPSSPSPPRRRTSCF